MRSRGPGPCLVPWEATLLASLAGVTVTVLRFSPSCAPPVPHGAVSLPPIASPRAALYCFALLAPCSAQGPLKHECLIFGGTILDSRASFSQNVPSPWAEMEAELHDGWSRARRLCLGWLLHLAAGSAGGLHARAYSWGGTRSAQSGGSLGTARTLSVASGSETLPGTGWALTPAR